jgi:hypothetical protein
MLIQPDFRDLLALLNSRGVDYLVVGGYALAFHGAPRFTGDIDLYVRPDLENGARIAAALDDFGFGGLDIRAEDFAVAHRVVQLGVPPVRVDIITSISGVDWALAWSSRVTGSYGDIPVFFIGLAALIANKRATARAKDLADLEALGVGPESSSRHDTT